MILNDSEKAIGDVDDASRVSKGEQYFSEGCSMQTTCAHGQRSLKRSPKIAICHIRGTELKDTQKLSVLVMLNERYDWRVKGNLHRWLIKLSRLQLCAINVRENIHLFAYESGRSS